MLSGKTDIEDWQKKTPHPNQSTYVLFHVHLGTGRCQASKIRYQSDSVVVLWVNTSLTTQESNQARGHTNV